MTDIPKKELVNAEWYDRESGEPRKGRVPYSHPDFQWSFSSITSYLECPYQFKLHYIDNVEDTGNAFSDYGNLIHETMELWAKGELMDFELLDHYESRYTDAMRHDYPPFPVTLAESNYGLGRQYFEEFVGFGDEYEIVSAEEKFETSFGKHKFRGISDLVLRNKETGKYIVIDHKTKSPASMARERELYTRQLYVYAKHVKEKYGEWPEYMGFNMTKSREIIGEKFSMERMDAVTAWIIESIEKALAEKDWTIGGSSYFCQHICSYRNSCEFSDRFKKDYLQKKAEKERLM